MTDYQAILDALVDGEPATNAEIAARSGVDLRIVQSRIGDLRSRNLVIRCGLTRPVLHRAVQSHRGGKLNSIVSIALQTQPISVFHLGSKQ